MDPSGLDKPWNHEHLTDEMIMRYIINTSGGFVESRVVGRDVEVQFIHESVIDFLLSNKRRVVLDLELSPNLSA